MIRAMRLLLAGSYHIEERKSLAKGLAGITEWMRGDNVLVGLSFHFLRREYYC